MNIEQRIEEGFQYLFTTLPQRIIDRAEKDGVDDGDDGDAKLMLRGMRDLRDLVAEKIKEKGKLIPGPDFYETVASMVGCALGFGLTISVIDLDLPPVVDTTGSLTEANAVSLEPEDDATDETSQQP